MQEIISSPQGLTSGAEARTHFERRNGTSELVPFPDSTTYGTTSFAPVDQLSLLAKFAIVYKSCRLS